MLKNLFEPISIGNLELKNRIVMSAMYTQICSVTGEVTEQTIYYYGERAKGGASMVIVELTAVDGLHTFKDPQLRIDEDIYISGLRRLSEVIHLNGAVACIQLHHAGMWGKDPVSPSGIPCFLPQEGWIQPGILSIDDIERIKTFFIEAALRAKISGFDMVELHGATSYLLQQFVSPRFNKRNDGYGGDFERRIRLPLEIVDGIRKKCGPNFPVGYRLLMDELLPDGINMEEAIKFAKRLEETGISYLSPIIGTYESLHLGEGQFAMRSPKAQTIRYTEALKKAVKVPVFSCYQNHDPMLMEDILKKGIADIIALGRPFLADPEFPEKVFERRFDDIRMCIRCCNCFNNLLVNRCQVACLQNPALGKERKYRLYPASLSKKVLVIGGGPAGLEAARVSALRGHEVILVEKEDSVGGQLKIASLPIGKEDYKRFVIEWLERECRKAGVNIILNREAKEDILEEVKPDVVVISTGAKTALPSDLIVEKKNLFFAVDVLKGEIDIRGKVVIVGGGEIGVETADFIAENGIAEDITLIEMLSEIAKDMDVYNKAYIMGKLYQYRVKIIMGLRVMEIREDRIIGIDKEFNKKEIEADTVIMATGMVPLRELYYLLREKIPEIYIIGDCKKPRKAMEAIHEGYYVGMQI
jgi:2,4-dienoyl-CoA reductase-like NADH-dependent reductase (Old Yellow Enzyme family)/thioredoxin reductase